jgi:hypothetical protein
MNILLILAAMGYGIGYDGFEDNKHYFQINTPKTNYGIVVSEKGIDCDMIYYKNST